MCGYPFTKQNILSVKLFFVSFAILIFMEMLFCCFAPTILCRILQMLQKIFALIKRIKNMTAAAVVLLLLFSVAQDYNIRYNSTTLQISLPRVPKKVEVRCKLCALPATDICVRRWLVVRCSTTKRVYKKYLYYLPTNNFLRALFL